VKTIIILAEGFEEIEAVTCIDVLRRSGTAVSVEAINDIKVKGSHGITVVADKKLTRADVDFDALILPGGMPGAQNLADSKIVNALITKASREGKIIAAICAAPSVVLGPSGILKNKSVTGFPGMRDNFGQTTRYKEEKVVVDGNLITSRGPGTAFLFALAIVEKMAGKDTAATLRKTTLAD
jgi:protein deglycase